MLSELLGTLSRERDRLERRAHPADTRNAVTTNDRSESVEVIQETLETLLREREELRSSGADAKVLERNRQAIIRTQWEFSHALIRRYHTGLQPA
jgi:hypothetical protein